MILEKAILKIYPNAVPNVDFFVMDEGYGAEIKHWKYAGSIPTKAQLEAAWAEVQDEPQELSSLEKLQQEQELMRQALDEMILGGSGI